MFHFVPMANIKDLDVKQSMILYIWIPVTRRTNKIVVRKFKPRRFKETPNGLQNTWKNVSLSNKKIIFYKIFTSSIEKYSSKYLEISLKLRILKNGYLENFQK